ncbi:hypothetical protein PSTT_08323 [Puccinia striiformis]|uniref:Uncharacterized protein n=1 Tax=Puccinia striiformis TaxID=27350 RepID=A0A2S4VCY7_9BASI|nr:hypothetical protein PSTT_08323 [Puccinia striiformis]
MRLGLSLPRTLASHEPSCLHALTRMRHGGR